MHGVALRGGGGPASLPPGVLIPLAAFAGWQLVPLLPAGAAAAQSLVCCSSPGATLPPGLFVIPDWPRAAPALLGVRGGAMLTVPERGCDLLEGSTDLPIRVCEGPD
jgi:hypothetical protein